ncbi:MAG: tetratricopeptide repeat protein [Nitrososphaerales archaeon]
MDRPSAYIPIDRRYALARGETLPERSEGAALFADISGFTPLTEALALELGPRRGAEELTAHLNRVYDAVITELHRFGGVVIGFSGDAITCWLAGDDGRRATAAALAMQHAMRRFREVRTHSGRAVSMGMKVAVATGSARRFAVGDPGYCLVDTIAGATLERLATGEHLAGRGDVVVDEVTATNLAAALVVTEWRVDAEGGHRFAVAGGLNEAVQEQPWPDLPDDALTRDVQAAWLLPRVYERLSQGRGEFLAELRPAFALFVHFTGIDYDRDEEAPRKLDAFVRGVEQILARFDGSLIQLTIGDKGSYLYAAFGAPVAHEDDGVRACGAALELQALAAGFPYLVPLQIGLTVGRMRTGAYGSRARRTYGVLGDATNLAARLMSAAQPGHILVSDEVRATAGSRFTWEAMPPVRVKGKSEPVSLSRLVALEPLEMGQLQEPVYYLPMVGRAAELARAAERMEEVAAGRGQIIAITAEAGMGKSRLAAELIRVARERLPGLVVLGGECQSYGTTTGYLVWQSIWRAFFGLAGAASVEAQLARMQERVASLDPALLPRLPLLGAVLNLAIPENNLTRGLDAKTRKAALEGLLAALVAARARTELLLIVLEDCHWLDDLSRDLIGVVGRAIADLPVLLLLAYRPPDLAHEQVPPVEQLPYFTEIALSEFTPEETERLVALKLAQMFGEGTPAAAALLGRVSTEAGGSPFYIEELLNYLKDVGVDMTDAAALAAIDLPDSIYALVLSRIDQLNESQQLTIKVASVIGPLFRAAMVWGIYPGLPASEVRRNLDLLSRLDLTPLDSPDPELTYLFKHVITQQVAYESLLYATREMLHEQIGAFIERALCEGTFPVQLDQYIHLLAFHYEHSANLEKKRVYLLEAGEAARRAFANTAAITYFDKVLPLLSGRAQIDARLDLGRVLELTGTWGEARSQYDTALAEATRDGDASAVAWCQTALGELSRKRSQYTEANGWFEQARSTFAEQGDQAGMGQVLHYAGTLAAQQGDFVLANERYNASLVLRRALGDRANEANLLNNLGIVARYLGNNDAARGYHEAALAIQEELCNRWTTAAIHNNLGTMAIDRGDLAAARRELSQALVVFREIGERWAITNTVHNLANVARDEGNAVEAASLYRQSLDGWQALNDRWGLAYWLEDVALLRAQQGAVRPAFELVGAADALREAIGNPRPPAYAGRLEGRLAPVAARLTGDDQATALAEGRSRGLEETVRRTVAALSRLGL